MNNPKVYPAYFEYANGDIEWHLAQATLTAQVTQNLMPLVPQMPLVPCANKQRSYQIL